MGQAALLSLLALSKSSMAAQPDTAVSEFIEQMVSEHGFKQEELTRLFAGRAPNPAILEAIQRPWEAKPWHQYHPLFLTEKRINKGVEFWQSHQESLQRAEQQFGVPAEIIVAIIGVETFYGTYQGKYAVLDSLYTLGFHYPPRSTFFKSELAQYLLMTREEGLDQNSVVGSYAGAMGWGQFISSSYRHYAVDFDQDGTRDLLNNPQDAIGSVANYFRKNGWKPGEAVAYPAVVEKAQVPSLLTDKLKPSQSWQSLHKGGVRIDGTAELVDEAPAKLLQFELTDGHEYWLGLHNFYVITRYNHSPLYAMAVYRLSQEIKAAMAG
ncbi:lytic murein transglycosylase B [Bowmanella dokdonensis]|uniref:Lytic murein transglycosylase B n=2 Tax=Bowmanella dokdonensis TaxID=751969 RepID=A0A939ISG3_9ALTE|nr:lytic murein transglycosylase B [Bowmanella dokdonensis]